MRLTFLYLGMLLALPDFCRAQSTSLAPSTPSSSIVDFDVDTLRTLGYGSEVAEFFKQGSQFFPGQHDVILKVNGSASYPTVVNIGDQGQLCVDERLQNTLKLNIVPLGPECTTLVMLYPGSKVTPRPNEFQIEVLMPETAFDPQRRGDDLTKGGFALLSNYRVYGMRMQGWDTQQFYQGQFETGANWDNWVLRNHSSFSSGKNSTQYQFNETTLSRSIAPLQSILQVGQISSQGDLFGGTPLTGAQLYSDISTSSGQRLVVPVTGIAEAPATVEVKQNGRLLYRTLVPAGPFELDRINHVVSGQPLNVTVIQEDGNRQQFAVTTAISDSERVGGKHFQMALGQYRDRNKDDDMRTPLIASAEGGLYIGSTGYTAGVLVSEGYQSMGGRLNTQWGTDKPVDIGIGLLTAHNQNNQGVQVDTHLNTSSGALSLGVSNLYRTKEYPMLEDSLWRDKDLIDDNEVFQGYSEIQTTQSISLSWSNIKFGRIGYSTNYNHYYGDKSDSIQHTFNYGRKWGDIMTNLSYQTGNDRDSRLFFNASMPLGQKASISMQMQKYRNDTNMNSSLSYRPSNLWGYSVGVGHSRETTRLTGSVNATTAYSQLAASSSWSDDNTSSMMFTASGALAYADGLVATSPVALGDTFGIVNIPGQSGVRVSTLGSGTTVTNHFGTAAIPTLSTQKKTTVQLDTQDVPLNVRLTTTSFDVTVARGTVISKEIKATVMRQLLLTVELANGQPAASGASVLDKNGLLIGVIMGQGNLMLTNEQIGQPIFLRSPNQNDCEVNYIEPAEFNSSTLYEVAPALCKSQ